MTYFDLPQYLVTISIPLLSILFAGLVTYILVRMQAFNETLESSYTRVNTIIKSAIVFYFTNNVDDFVEKSFAERVTLLENYLEGVLKSRGYQVELDSISDLVTENLIDLHDKLEAIYKKKNS